MPGNAKRCSGIFGIAKHAKDKNKDKNKNKNKDKKERERKALPLFLSLAKGGEIVSEEQKAMLDEIGSVFAELDPVDQGKATGFALGLAANKNTKEE